MASNFPGWRWWALAGVLLLSALLMTLLSKSFVYGVGHAERPIVHFVALYGIWWGAFAASFWMLKSRREQPGLVFIIAVAVALRVILFASDLIQENDVYRYVLDGQVLLHGGNPYEFSPLEVSEMGTPALRESLAAEDAQTVLNRIGYPSIPTVYPPAAQLAFAAGSAVGGWNWIGQRVVFTLVDLLVIGVLVYLLKLFSVPSYWLILYVWNPLVLKEVTNSTNLDILVALFIILLVIGISRFCSTGSKVWIGFAALSWGLAVLAKVYPLILGPACLIWLYKRGKKLEEPVLFGGIGTAVIILGLVPFFGIGAIQLTEGIVTYASDWRMNEGAFAVFSWLFSNPRMTSWAVIALVAIVLPLLHRERTVDAFVRVIQWILLVWFLLLPAVFPWYAIPLAGLLVLSPGSRTAVPLVVLSGAVVLYYLSFFYDYRGYQSEWWDWTRLIEHALIWGSILISLYRTPKHQLPIPN